MSIIIEKISETEFREITIIPEQVIPEQRDEKVKKLQDYNAELDSIKSELSQKESEIVRRENAKISDSKVFANHDVYIAKAREEKENIITRLQEIERRIKDVEALGIKESSDTNPNA